MVFQWQADDDDLEECDHCGLALHRDLNGWWVGRDGTSDCSTNEGGHEVDGHSK